MSGKVIQIIRSNEKQRFWLISLACSLVIAIAAQIQLPLIPVPVTLQTLAIVGIAMIMGPAIGLTAVLAYLAEGALGLPVFAGFSGGVVLFFGPTGGYLLGFLVMTAMAGFCTQRLKHITYLPVFVISLLAMLMTLVCGAIGLAQFVPWNQVFALGVSPLLLGAVLKSLFLAVIVPSFCKARNSRSQ